MVSMGVLLPKTGLGFLRPQERAQSLEISIVPSPFSDSWDSEEQGTLHIEE
jgi:hypothetical protein